MNTELTTQNESTEDRITAKKVYTVYEIQSILGIGLSTAYKLIKEKKFHSVKVGQRVMISKKSFDAWLRI